MDEDKKKEQLTQQEVSKRVRVMGVFLLHDALKAKLLFSLFFLEKEEKKKKIVDLFFLPTKKNLRLFSFTSKHFLLRFDCDVYEN
jgi:hypothetical protein